MIFENRLGILNPAATLKFDGHSKRTILDAFCYVLQGKLKYEPGERDMVCMHNIFEYIDRNGVKGTKEATLITYGDPNGYSAMAKTVGLPAAMVCLKEVLLLLGSRDVVGWSCSR